VHDQQLKATDAAAASRQVYYTMGKTMEQAGFTTPWKKLEPLNKQASHKAYLWLLGQLSTLNHSSCWLETWQADSQDVPLKTNR
jgi:hypothetical protein